MKDTNKWNRSPAGKVAMRRRARAFKKKRGAENRRVLDELKTTPCADCGGTFDPVCMDFDHRPGEIKLRAVSAMVWTAPLDVMLAEVAKCDLVCANCHRIRTHRKRDHRALVRDTTPQVSACEAKESVQLGLAIDEAKS